MKFISDTILILIIILFQSIHCSGQELNDLQKLFRQTITIDTKEGSSVKGELINYSDTSLVLYKDSIKQYFAKEAINGIWQKKSVSYDPYPQYGVMLPTAFNLESIEYRNDLGLLSRLSFPILGNLSATIGGIFFLGKDDNFYLSSLKYSIPINKFFISPNLTYLNFPREDEFLFPSIALSYGTPKSHLNLGVGYGMDLSDEYYTDDFSSIILGGYQIISSKFGITSENILIKDGGDIILFSTLLFNWTIKSSRFGLGLFAGHYTTANPVFFPNFTFSYSKRKRFKKYYNFN